MGSPKRQVWGAVGEEVQTVEDSPKIQRRKRRSIPMRSYVDCAVSPIAEPSVCRESRRVTRSSAPSPPATFGHERGTARASVTSSTNRSPALRAEPSPNDISSNLVAIAASVCATAGDVESAAQGTRESRANQQEMTTATNSVGELPSASVDGPDRSNTKPPQEVQESSEKLCTQGAPDEAPVVSSRADALALGWKQVPQAATIQAQQPEHEASQGTAPQASAEPRPIGRNPEVQAGPRTTPKATSTVHAFVHTGDNALTSRSVSYERPKQQNAAVLRSQRFVGSRSGEIALSGSQTLRNDTSSLHVDVDRVWHSAGQRRKLFEPGGSLSDAIDQTTTLSPTSSGQELVNSSCRPVELPAESPESSIADVNMEEDLYDGEHQIGSFGRGDLHIRRRNMKGFHRKRYKRGASFQGDAGIATARITKRRVKKPADSATRLSKAPQETGLLPLTAGPDNNTWSTQPRSYLGPSHSASSFECLQGPLGPEASYQPQTSLPAPTGPERIADPPRSAIFELETSTARSNRTPLQFIQTPAERDEPQELGQTVNSSEFDSYEERQTVGTSRERRQETSPGRERTSRRKEVLPRWERHEQQTNRSRSPVRRHLADKGRNKENNLECDTCGSPVQKLQSPKKRRHGTRCSAHDSLQDDALDSPVNASQPPESNLQSVQVIDFACISSGQTLPLEGRTDTAPERYGSQSPVQNRRMRAEEREESLQLGKKADEKGKGRSQSMVEEDLGEDPGSDASVQTGPEKSTAHVTLEAANQSNAGTGAEANPVQQPSRSSLRRHPNRPTRVSIGSSKTQKVGSQREKVLDPVKKGGVRKRSRVLASGTKAKSFANTAPTTLRRSARISALQRASGRRNSSKPTARSSREKVKSPITKPRPSTGEASQQAKERKTPAEGKNGATADFQHPKNRPTGRGATQIGKSNQSSKTSGTERPSAFGPIRRSRRIADLYNPIGVSGQARVRKNKSINGKKTTPIEAKEGNAPTECESVSATGAQHPENRPLVRGATEIAESSQSPRREADVSNSTGVDSHDSVKGKKPTKGKKKGSVTFALSGSPRQAKGEKPPTDGESITATDSKTPEGVIQVATLSQSSKTPDVPLGPERRSRRIAGLDRSTNACSHEEIDEENYIKARESENRLANRVCNALIDRTRRSTEAKATKGKEREAKSSVQQRDGGSLTIALADSVTQSAKADSTKGKESEAESTVRQSDGGTGTIVLANSRREMVKQKSNSGKKGEPESSVSHGSDTITLAESFPRASRSKAVAKGTSRATRKRKYEESPRGSQHRTSGQAAKPKLKRTRKRG